MLRWIEGVVASSLFPFSRQRCGYRVIDDWIDSEQRRDLQSNSIDPFASISKLLHGFGWQGIRLAGGLDNASAGFVLSRLKTRFRRFRGANFLRVQASSGVH